ncbi:hypothetical protein ACQKWADRAFT_315874 [Trichoderma austrokoningii]
MLLIFVSIPLLLLSIVDAKKPKLKPNPLTDPGPYRVENFLLLDIIKKTTIDPYVYLKDPGFGFPSRLQCLPPEEGIVDFLGCTYVNDKWKDLTDENGNIALKAGECRSVTHRCCQCTICAPKGDITVTPGQIGELLFWKTSEDCLVGHMGAVYVNEGWEFLVVTARPPSCWAKEHRPDPAKPSEPEK